MLGADDPGLELVGGLSLELGARFIPCVWQTTAAVATWLWILEVVLVVWSVCGELTVAALLRLLVLLYLVPPRASPVTSTSMFSETLTITSIFYYIFIYFILNLSTLHPVILCIQKFFFQFLIKRFNRDLNSSYF